MDRVRERNDLMYVNCPKTPPVYWLSEQLPHVRIVARQACMKLQLN